MTTTRSHPHESPNTNGDTLMVLAGLSVVGGLVGSPLLKGCISSKISCAVHHAPASWSAPRHNV